MSAEGVSALRAVEAWSSTLSYRPLRPDEAEDAVNAMLDLASAYTTQAAALAVAERERDTLRAALQPFANGAEAFDHAEGTYGDGPVFERLNDAAHWKFTIADVRRAAAAVSPDGEA
jgi:hypothetical protein